MLFRLLPKIPENLEKETAIAVLDLGKGMEWENPQSALPKDIHDEPLPRRSLIMDRMIRLRFVAEVDELQIDIGMRKYLLPDVESTT